MSEYQFYEFQALDRPLSVQQQDKIGALSSRVELTPTSAIFTYNYGDFPGNPELVLARYYDAMLYTSNFGSRQLMFRFPVGFIQAADLKPFCLERAVGVRISGKNLVLNMRVDEEPSGEWVEGNGLLGPLLTLRQSLLENDFRALYLGWLKCAQALHDMGEEVAQKLEPPVPPNLSKLTPPLRALIDFLELDDDLVKLAARTSHTVPIRRPAEYEKLLDQLPEVQRREFLQRLLRGEPNLTHLLQQHLLKSQPAAPAGKALAALPRRTMGALLKELDDTSYRDLP